MVKWITRITLSIHGVLLTAAKRSSRGLDARRDRVQPRGGGNPLQQAAASRALMERSRAVAGELNTDTSCVHGLGGELSPTETRAVRKGEWYEEECRFAILTDSGFWLLPESGNMQVFGLRSDPEWSLRRGPHTFD